MKRARGVRWLELGRAGFLAFALSPSVRAEPAAAPPWPAAVALERHTLLDGTRVVLEADATVASVGVCVRKPGTPPAEDVANDLAKHGAEVRVGESSFCARVAPADADAALRVAAALWKTAWPAEPATGARGSALSSAVRARELSLEGAERAPSAGSAVAIAGNLPLDRATALVESYFGRLGPPGASVPAWILHQTTERLSVSIGEGDSPRLDLVWPIPADAPAGAAAFATAVELWAGSDGARLPRLLAGARGMSRQVHAASTDLPGGRILQVTVELTSRATVERVLRFVDGSLRRLRLSLPSRHELDRAVALLTRQAVSAWEDPLTRAEGLAASEVGRGDAGALLAEYSGLAAVTPAAVREAAQGTLVGTHRSSVETYPKRWPPDDPKLQGYVLHTAEDGDTLASIAVRYGTTVAALARANDLDPRYRLGAGQGIWVKAR